MLPETVLSVYGEPATALAMRLKVPGLAQVPIARYTLKVAEAGAPLAQVTWTWFGALAEAVPMAGAPGAVQTVSVSFAVQISSRALFRRSVQEGKNCPAMPERLL